MGRNLGIKLVASKISKTTPKKKTKHPSKQALELATFFKTDLIRTKMTKIAKINIMRLVKMRKKGLVKTEGPVSKINKPSKTAKLQYTLTKIIGICSLKRVLKNIRNIGAGTTIVKYSSFELIIKRVVFVTLYCKR